MKKSLLFLSFALVVASAPVLFAQDDGSTNSSSTTAPSSRGGNSAGGNGQHAGKWKAVFEQLDLSDTQKAQIKQIRANTQPGKERRQQIMAVLTPDQKQKLVSLLKEYQAEQAGQ
jgi:Spy/CpxP family protein refolding chaperone